MSPESNGDTRTVLSPNDAFAVLGNETRMEILQTLGNADGPLSFSELRDRVGMRDSGQFNYHLDKVDGHFVSKTGDGYELRQAGRRVIQTVFSGAVTEDPVIEPTVIDEPCPLCGASTVVAFYQERLDHYCTDCNGYYGVTTPLTDEAPSSGRSSEQAEYGYIGSVPFPPAGLQGRTAEEVFQASVAWFLLEVLAIANHVCPRCSAPLEESLRICEEHETTDGTCGKCSHRHAILLNSACSNCLYDRTGAFGLRLLTADDLLAFLLSHGINPISPSARAAYYAVLVDYEEEILSVQPFEARFTFRFDQDTLTLTVDDDLSVVSVTREQSTAAE